MKSRFLGGFLGFFLKLVVLVIVFGVLASLVRFIEAVLQIGAFKDDNDIDGAIRNIGLVLAASFGAPFIAWRSYVAHKQTLISEQSHITEQINKAVEGLGAEKIEKNYHSQTIGTNSLDADLRITPVEKTVPNIEVRVGSIYALERIAQDSLRDHVQIMEILTAYLRNNFPADEVDSTPLELLQFYESHARASEYWKWAHTKVKLPRTDQEVAIQVIGRRSPAQINKERNDKRYRHGRGFTLDLSNTNLRRIRVSGLNFEYASFMNSRLEGANFPNTKLRNTNMRGAQLTGSNFLGADLWKSRFTKAALFGTDFTSAWLGEVTFGIPEVGQHILDETTSLDRAWLHGTKLSRHKLFAERMGKVSVSFETTLPESYINSTILIDETHDIEEARQNWKKSRRRYTI